MTIKLQLPKLTHLRPRITVVGVGGAGSNAVNNMITSGLTGVNFAVANTDAQSLDNSAAESRIQLGAALTEGLGAGAKPEIGKAAAEEALEDIRAQVAGSHMVFVAAGMGGGTGTGATAVIARVARECGALTVGVVTKPFHFEGTRRMRAAEAGIAALKPEVDTLIVIPNQNLFRIANERTTFAEAFVLADQVLYSGIACVVDLIVKEGLINLDFADVRTIMSGMGTAMMGTGEASGEKRAVAAAEEAISNPLLDDISLRGAKGLLLSITGGPDLKLYEVDEAAQRVRQEIDGEANIIVGATFDESLGDRIRVSIVASGMERLAERDPASMKQPPHNGVGYAQGRPPQPDDLQPPFIEPYPDPYAAQPRAAAPVQTPHPMAQPPEFARALSEALEMGPESEGAYHAAPAPPQRAASHDHHLSSWTSADGAVFHEAPAHVGGESSMMDHDHAAQSAHARPTFHPQPPGDMSRQQRRLPDVQDFPIVGQREYHAKAAQYSDPKSAAAPPPRAYGHPSASPPAKPKVGFFKRLLGFATARMTPPRRASYQQAPERVLAERERAIEQERYRQHTGIREHRRDGEERVEMPAFFGGDRK